MLALRQLSPEVPVIILKRKLLFISYMPLEPMRPISILEKPRGPNCHLHCSLGGTVGNSDRERKSAEGPRGCNGLMGKDDDCGRGSEPSLERAHQ